MAERYQLLRESDSKQRSAIDAAFKRICAKNKRPLRKPKWGKVSKVLPDSKGINLMLKCVSCSEVKKEDGPSSRRIWEAVVGDDTGVVTLDLRSGQHAEACQPGASLRLQNAKVVMIRGFIRIAVDKWAVLKTAAEEVSFEAKTSKDI